MTVSTLSTRHEKVSYENLAHDVPALLASAAPEHSLPLLVSLLGEPLLFIKLIKAILADDEWLNRVQKASYYHRNGFDKLVLLEAGEYKVRLHWFRPQGKLLPAENVHDHRWPFASKILSGTLQMDMLQPALHGEPFLQYQYDSKKINGRYNVSFLQHACLHVYEQLVYSAGQQYLMPTTDLHRIVYHPACEAMTLMITGKPERQDCRLFASKEIMDEEQQALPYPTQVLRKKLQEIIAQFETANH